jgi:photosystem II stability/assembly factor-like uncharacterized protein
VAVSFGAAAHYDSGAGWSRSGRAEQAHAQAPGQSTPLPTNPPPAGTWRLLHGPTKDPLWTDPPVLRGIHGAEDEDGVWRGYAVGDDGAIVRFDGTTWKSPIRLDPGGGRAYEFRDVFVAAPDDVWLVGHVTGGRNCAVCGALLHFNGTSWRELEPQEYGVINRTAPLNAIDLIPDGAGGWTGWIVGDDADFDNTKAIILQRADGRWRLWTGSNNIAKNLYDVKVIAADEAWAVGQDGSESWYDARDGVGGWPRLGASGVDTLYAVDLADPLFGWDGGAAGRMNHYEGSCHDGTTATQCWFDNHARPVKSQGGQVLNLDVNDIDLRSRTYGWLVGAPFSRTSVVAYLDGEAWRLVTVQDDPGKALYAMHMVHDGRAYAVGDDGAILAYEDLTLPTPSPSTTPTVTVTATATTDDLGTATATPTPSVEGGTSTPSPTGDGELTSTPTPSTSVTDTPETPDTPPPSPSGTPTPTPTATPTATLPDRSPYRLFAPVVVTRRGTM